MQRGSLSDFRGNAEEMIDLAQNRPVQKCEKLQNGYFYKTGRIFSVSTE